MVLNELWLDTVFLGVDAVSALAGATCRHEGEAGINALMVQRADRVVVVATGEGRRRAFARICPHGADRRARHRRDRTGWTRCGPCGPPAWPYEQV